MDVRKGVGGDDVGEDREDLGDERYRRKSDYRQSMRID